MKYYYTFIFVFPPIQLCVSEKKYISIILQFSFAFDEYSILSLKKYGHPVRQNIAIVPRKEKAYRAAPLSNNQNICPNKLKYIKPTLGKIIIF